MTLSKILKKFEKSTLKVFVLGLNQHLWACYKSLGLLYTVQRMPKGLELSRAQPPPTCQHNVSACIKNIRHRDV